jgi:hypothetical protein
MATVRCDSVGAANLFWVDIEGAKREANRCLALASRQHCIKPSIRMWGFSTTSYFSFTKSKTKIAHTPTVIGN